MVALTSRDIRWRFWLAEALLVYVVASLLYGAVLMPMDRLHFDDDGYYHFRIAQMIASGRPWVDITWLPMTILGSAGPDHHWFWHLVVAPFTWLGRNDLESLKLATVLTGALVPAALSLAARMVGLPYAPLIGLLAAASNWILPLRYLMLRAQTISIILILFAIVSLYRRSAVALFAVAFLFMNAYHGAIILVPIAGVWLLVDHSLRGEFQYRLLLAVLAGLLMALILSPWAPATFGYLLFHTVYKMMSTQHLNVGAEWYPLPWVTVVEHGLAGHLALVAGALVYGWRRFHARQADEQPSILSIVLCFMSVALVIAYHSALRFAEYASPIEVFAGISLLKDSRILDTVRGARVAVPAFLGALVVAGSAVGMSLVDHTRFYSTDRYEKTSAYLEAHGQAGDMILNIDWSSFVFMFWHTQKFNLVSGLDPHYLAYASPEAFRVTQVYEHDQLTATDPAVVAKNLFHARWFLIDDNYPNLRAALSASTHAKVVVDDGVNGVLFQIF